MSWFVCENDGSFRVTLKQVDNSVALELNGVEVGFFDSESDTLLIQQETLKGLSIALELQNT